MISSNWNTVKLKEVLDINPSTKLKKGTEAKKVSMGDIKEYVRKIDNYETSVYKGGSKFQNNDTLFARITPCLENGKIAFVNILDKDEVAFGSTEFLVLRAKNKKADPKFIYYLSISNYFRDFAIKSMTGTSGRQRVQKESLLELNINLPCLKKQEKISSFLDSLDRKIELNSSIIENLEELAQALFKRWFVDFEFPNENSTPYKSSGGKMVESELGLTPEDWQVNRFNELIKISSGKRPTKKEDGESENFNVPVIGASNIMGYTNEVLFDEPIVVIGRVGTHGVVQRIQDACWPSDNTFVMRSDYTEFIYQFLKTVDYESMNRGSTQPLLAQKDIKNIKLPLPSIFVLEKFEQQQQKYTSLNFQKRQENEYLSVLRDTLLPKLLSGEIEIPKEMEVTDDVPIS